MLSELTNEQRKYLGLVPVAAEWERVKLNNSIYLYFDGPTIRKKINISDKEYCEQELCEQTAENRTVLLPKTAKGKPKKLNFTATQSFSPFGVYFSYSEGALVQIANYTTQTAYYYDGKISVSMNDWLSKWISESTEKDLADIEAFRNLKRQHYKFKEGDFFTFKIGRHKWGFGRILLDVATLRKQKEFKEGKNYGLSHLMGRPVIVKIYHKISDTKDIDVDDLATCMALPSEAVMDNRLYYGEYEIIGHRQLKPDEHDMLISYARSINHADSEIDYLQYGLIYRETPISTFDKYIQIQDEQSRDGYLYNPYRNEGVSFGLRIDELERCIAAKSNTPYWNVGWRKRDLRNPMNAEIRHEIFAHFGLDANKSYLENAEMLK